MHIYEFVCICVNIFVLYLNIVRLNIYSYTCQIKYHWCHMQPIEKFMPAIDWMRVIIMSPICYVLECSFCIPNIGCGIIILLLQSFHRGLLLQEDSYFKLCPQTPWKEKGLYNMEQMTRTHHNSHVEDSWFDQGVFSHGTRPLSLQFPLISHLQHITMPHG